MRRGVSHVYLKAAASAGLTFLLGLLAVFCHRSIPVIACLPPGSSLPYITTIDDNSYKLMAEGHSELVYSPFTKRVLYPFLARTLAHCSGITLARTCVALNLAAWTMLAFFLALLLYSEARWPWMAAPLLLTPMPLSALFLAYMPELLHMAFVAAFILFLWRGRDACALAALFAACVTRENTLLLCAVTIGVTLARGRRKLALGTLAVMATGFVIGAWFCSKGLANPYHLPDFVYLGLKTGYNALRGYLGIMFWTNVAPDRTTPMVIWHLPRFLQWGQVRLLGVNWTDSPVQWTWISLLTVFGFAPLVLWRWRRILWEAYDWPMSVRIAAIYGAISMVLGPALGASAERLVGEGWPLIWIALPWVAGHVPMRWEPGSKPVLAVCYVLIAWIPHLGGFGEARFSYLWAIPVATLYFMAARRLPFPSRRDSRRDGEPAPVSLQTQST